MYVCGGEDMLELVHPEGANVACYAELCLQAYHVAPELGRTSFQSWDEPFLALG